MKSFITLLGTLALFTFSANASYLEEWVLEAEVLEVCDAKQTAKFQEEHKDYQAEGKVKVVVKVKVLACEIQPGSHGKKLCKKGEEKTILLGSDDSLDFKKGDKISVNYFYVSSRGGGSSHRWKLIKEK